MTTDTERQAEAPSFRSELEATINRCSMENGSNTPDFILAKFLRGCLEAFDAGVRARETWYGRDPDIGPAGMRTEAPSETPGASAQEEEPHGK